MTDLDSQLKVSILQCMRTWDMLFFHDQDRLPISDRPLHIFPFPGFDIIILLLSDKFFGNFWHHASETLSGGCKLKI